MNYILCPTCGNLLGTKSLIYEQKMQEICKKYKVDYDKVSRGLLNTNKELTEEKSKLINSLCTKMCCKTRIITHIDICPLIVKEVPLEGRVLNDI